MGINLSKTELGKINKITRVEVIDEDGIRRYVRHNCSVVESIQDNGKTLKLFINKSLENNE